MTSALSDRLRRRIQRDGPISFADFMEAALYDPVEGFYARPPVGRHFVTSPHVSPAFGALVARQVAECWDLLGRPDPFTVVELGAGDGTLARQVLAAVASTRDLAAAMRYVGVERTPGQLEAARGAGIEVAASLAEVGPLVGCVVANELLDNVPFHRLRVRDGELLEIMVGAEDGGFVEVERPAPDELRAMLPEPLEPGEDRPVSPAAASLVREVGPSLERGYAFFVDYAFTGAASPVHAYLAHRVTGDVLTDPGSRDITAGVDLQAVLSAARAAGLQAWGPVSQREALLGLGYRLWAAGMRKRIEEAEGSGDRSSGVRLRAALSASSILIDETKLGGLSLVAFANEGLPAPAAVLGDRGAGC